MTLNEYQRLSCRTMNSTLDERTQLATLALGLSGESGECAEHIKKHLGHGHALDREAMTKELGDVLWYVASLAAKIGVTLDEVATVNLDKLRVRYPNGFSEQDSKNRV